MTLRGCTVVAHDDHSIGLITLESNSIVIDFLTEVGGHFRAHPMPTDQRRVSYVGLPD